METKKPKKKKVEKLSTKQIMSLIVDENLLAEKREQSKKEKPKETVEQETKQKEKWWENLSKSDFIKKEHDGRFYARHKSWKNNIWIGAYSSEKEVDSVINSYIREIKKPPMYRNIKNVHSICSDDID